MTFYIRARQRPALPGPAGPTRKLPPPPRPTAAARPGTPPRPAAPPQQEQQRERKIRQQQDIEVDHSLDGRHLLSGRYQCSRRWGRKRAKERLCFCIKPLSRGLCRDGSPSRGALGIPSRFRGLALRSCLPCWRKVFPLRQMMILEPKANQLKNESPAKASPTRGGGIER